MHWCIWKDQIFFPKVSVQVNCSYLTTVELLPPKSKLDPFVLTGGCVCVVACTTQVVPAVLGTQVKQAVAKMYANILRFLKVIYVLHVLMKTFLGYQILFHSSNIFEVVLILIHLLWKEEKEASLGHRSQTLKSRFRI